MDKSDKFIIGAIILLLLACAFLALEIYRRPQLKDVSRLIAVEAPINKEERETIRKILDNVLTEIAEADTVRSQILEEIKEGSKVRNQLLIEALAEKQQREELKNEHQKMLELLDHGPK